MHGPDRYRPRKTGNPQIDQYTENVPDSGGELPTGGNSDGGGGDATSGDDGPDEPVLEPEQRSELEDLGEDGAGVADLTEDTSPSAGGTGGSGDGGDPGAEADFSSPSTTSSGADGDDGLGLLLPLIIGGLALGGLGFAVWRLRAAGTPA